MAIILPHPMTTQEIRVLQEFRRLTTDTLTASSMRSIRHPVNPGEDPAHTLISKGYLTSAVTAEAFTLTQKGKDFLALDVKPEFE